jgi:hypothetical protein
VSFHKGGIILASLALCVFQYCDAEGASNGPGLTESNRQVRRFANEQRDHPLGAPIGQLGDELL